MGAVMKSDAVPAILKDYEERLSKKQPGEGVLPTPQKRSTELSRVRNPSGIVASLDNAKRAVQQLGIVFRYDTFRMRITVEGYNGPVGETMDDIELKVRDHINERLGFDPEPKHMRDAIRILAMQNSFDPVKNYLDNLVWDGKCRLDAWMSDYLGAKDDELTRAMGRTTLIAAVRRARRPGCKFDFVLVLEGSQGTGKSSALKVLAGGEDYFSDEIVIGESYKEQQELLRGKWIVELPELAGLSNAEVRRVKQFTSKSHDRARGAWQRSVEEMPRRCILIGTTNDAQYLRDTTGNRRFWPVVTGRIDLEGLRVARDQLFAEAAEAEVSAPDPVTIPEPLWGAAAERQAARVAADPWEDILAEALSRVAKNVEGELRITSASIFEHILGIKMATARQTDSRRLAECMRRLGWVGPNATWMDGKAQRAYVKTARN